MKRNEKNKFSHLTKDTNNIIIKKSLCKKNNKYTLEFKKEVFEYYFINGGKKTLENFIIGRSTLTMWRTKFKRGELEDEELTILYNRKILH